MKVSADKKLIRELLFRSIDKIYPTRESLEKELLSGRRLRVYLGIDPTSPHLHIGHAASLWTLRRFQNLGHETILLVGDFTARIGDPSDKLAPRQPLTEEEIKVNLKTFKEQAQKIIDFSGPNPARLEFNSRWHDKMTFNEVIKLAQNFTVPQILNRDMFKKRLSFTFVCPSCKDVQIKAYDPFYENGNLSDKTAGELFKDSVCENCKRKIKFGDDVKEFTSPKPVYLHEFLYPLMQGYDSVAMDVDIEIGGTDQTFNMLAGRTLVRKLKNKEKFVITNRLLVDAASGKKLSKTESSLVNLDDEPNDMFGKIMALPDGMISGVAELSTQMPMTEIQKLEKIQNPRDAKLELAFEVVKLYHSEKNAKESKTDWIKTFSKKELPGRIDILVVKNNSSTVETIRASGIPSNSEAMRLLKQGAIKVDGKIKTAEDAKETRKNNEVIEVGKKKIFRIKTK